MAELRMHADKQVPVIIEWFSSDDSPAPGEPHYSIVLEVTDTRIRILDPEDGKQHEMSHVKFMSTWFSFSGAYIKTTDSVRLRMYLPLTQKR
jgi:ABC-type bacteriocin/lantibiotic exporter with double-glycine peptidase domain